MYLHKRVLLAIFALIVILSAMVKALPRPEDDDDEDKNEDKEHHQQNHNHNNGHHNAQGHWNKGNGNSKGQGRVNINRVGVNPPGGGPGQFQRMGDDRIGMMPSF
ncbi:hypothetical protein H4219_004052 [Mycoemilia scoparia]|uniref:Uncharacterized protein n=1 Tax=Mycoemilia scoparia TaxID=417184 RepID=A0A9W7ZTS5_9FUNG|nr:hypothetical protein H4219_004052 [Mycoemilia scoparia]